jgi:hypothetical protein
MKAPRTRVALTAIALALLAACGGSEPPVEVAGSETGLRVGAFDAGASADLMAQAQAAEDAGDLATAQQVYEQSALAWPDNAFAWEAVAATAQRRGDQETEAAARFILGKVETYPSDQLYVQREINQALKTYVAEQRDLPESNPVQQHYIEQLSAFYDTLRFRRTTRTRHRPAAGCRPCRRS